MKRRQLLKTALGTVAGGGMLAAANQGAAASGRPIPIGAGISLSGSTGFDGEGIKNAAEMAADEINAMGGILGRPIEIIIEDTKDQGPENVTRAVQKLIHRHGVHAIVNGYNIGALCAEYEAVADAGIPYIHHNTDIKHHRVVGGDPERYFGIFMGDPAEYWYGEGLLVFLNSLEATGAWTPQNRKIAVVTGAETYSMVIADAIRDKASRYGWKINLFDIVDVPITDWEKTLSKLRRDPPAIIAVTHWTPEDLAQFMLQFAEDPINSLVYMQYGPSLPLFREIAGEAANGVLYSTVIATLRDEIGNAFSKDFRERFGEDSTPLTSGQIYDSLHYFALAAAAAGGTGAPGDFEQNRKVADRLRNTTYRGVMGTTRFFIPEQAAIPYPDATNDPSLGMPHQFLQHQDNKRDGALIAPEPYITAPFIMPPWFKS